MMRLVHLSDTHLGYRAYSRITERGVNQREVDVLEVFEQALRKTAELEPDLVVITGDVFHTVRPGNYSLMHAYRLLRRFQQKRGGSPLVLIAGNHETPRSLETGCILGLFEHIPGVVAVYDTVRWLELNGAGVLCIPSRGVPFLERTTIQPKPEHKVNLMLIHGILDGLTTYTLSYPVPRQVILNDDWDYIGLGDYHMYTKVAENAYYAGSTDFTSNNIWEEVPVPKNLIEFDTETRKATLHPLRTRPVIDLPIIDAEDLTAEEVNEQIRRNAEGAGLEDSIVRQRVFNLRHEVRNAISADLLRELRARALHYHFDPRPPRAFVQRSFSSSTSDLGHERRTLEDEWRAFVANYDLPKEVDRKKLMQEGLNYLQAGNEH